MQDLKIIRETTFVKGYNDKLKPELLLEGYCSDALNCFVDDQTIKKRGGYTEQGTDVSISKSILSQSAVEFSDGTTFIIRARDDAAGTNCVIETWNGSGAWTSLAASQTASKDHVFVVAKDACYIMNDTDVVLKTSNGTTTSTVASFPVGVDAKWFHNYMFVLRKDSRLFWSDLNDPDTWDQDNNFIDVNPGDGDTAIGLATLKDELEILKQDRVWSLTGFGTADFTVSDMGERLTGTGTVGRKSIVETGNDVYFLSLSGGVPHFRSIMRTKEGFIMAGEIISDAIEGTMKGLNKNALYGCAGIFDGRKIWWSVPVSGPSNDLALVYDTLTKAWTRHTGINAADWCVSSVGGFPEVYFGEATETAKTYKLDDSTSDNGTAIDMRLVSRMYNPFPERKCKWKYLTVAADLTDDADLDVDYSVDGITFTDLATVSLTHTGGEFPYEFGSAFAVNQIDRERIDSGGGTSYKMMYRFANNTTTDDVTIREYQVMYKPRGLRSKS